MTLSKNSWNSRLSSHIHHIYRAINRSSGLVKCAHGLKMRRTMFLMLMATVAVAARQVQLRSLSSFDSADPSAARSTASGKPGLANVRPTPRTMLDNYSFDTFGPYAFVSAAFIAGLDQEDNTPPEWKQGFGGYARRFGSDFGIAAIETTTRYGLAEALREDTLYYRCECRGLAPRLRHAVISSLTGRRGEDGHRVFSIPALVAPYASSMVATYAWYPGRFGAKDVFRMGSYSLLGYVGENISLEFFYSGPHSLLARMHLNNAHGSTVQGPNR